MISNGAIHFGDLSTVSAGAMVTHTFNSEVWVTAGSTWSIDGFVPVEVAGLFRPSGTPSEPFPNETEPMTKGGDGTLIISGDNGNVYTSVIVNAGEVILRNGNALPDVSQLEIKPGATLTVEDDETIGTLRNEGHVALGSNTLRLAGTLFAETKGISGTVTGDASSRLEMAATGASLTENISGSIQVGRVKVSGGTMNVSGTGTITLPDLATSEINVNGAQSVFQVSNGGTVQMPTVASLTQPAGSGLVTNGASMTISQSGSSVSGGRIDIGASAVSSDLTVSSGGLLDISLGQSPAIVVGINQSGAGDGALIVESGGDVQTRRLYVGVFSDNVGAVSVSGAGSTLVADDAYLGGADLAQFGGVATLSVSDGGAVTLEGGTLDIFTDACSVIVDGGVLSTMLIDTVGSARPTMALSDPEGGSALRLGDNDIASITIIDFPISDASGGPGSLQKIGLGSLLLAHGGTYSGGVTVTGGNVRLADAARQFPSLTGSGPVLFTGLRLDGTGVVAGTLSVAGSGVLAPSQESGAGIDRIECGALNLGAGTTTEIQLGGLGSFDQVYVEGEASLGGMLSLSYQGGFAAAPGDWFEIIDAGDITRDFDTILWPDGQPWTAYRAGGSLWVGICAEGSACLADCIDEVGVYGPRDGVSSVVGAGGIFALNRGPAGVELVAAGISLATIPATVSAVENLKAMALDGTRLALAGGAPRLYDISDPTNPILQWSGSLDAYNVAIGGNLLAVAHSNGLSLYDITNPAAPVLKGGRTAPIPDGLCATVTFHDGLLYWSWQGDSYDVGEVVILDVADPTNPVELGSISAIFFVTEPLFKDDIMLLSNSVGVRAIDISDVTHPTQVASVNLPGFEPDHQAALVGGLLYRITPLGMTVVDVSDPSAPVVLDTLAGFNMAVRGGVSSIDGGLYVAGRHGLSVLDAGDMDFDGVTDHCDVCEGDDASGDSDGDGICDDLDNCPLVANPDEL